MTTYVIDKPVEIDQKENLRDHHLYWIGRRAQDIVLSSVATGCVVAGYVGYSHCYCGR